MIFYLNLIVTVRVKIHERQGAHNIASDGPENLVALKIKANYCAVASSYYHWFLHSPQFSNCHHFYPLWYLNKNVNFFNSREVLIFLLTSL